MKSYAGLLLALSIGALAATACSSTVMEIACDPACTAAFTCDTSQGVCVPNGVVVDDSGVPVVPDLAVATCSPACSGQLAHCNANHRCVACLADGDCPAGNLCKSEVC